MMILILGGSGSGKSAFAEDIATSMSNSLLYIATMQPFGDEALARINRHIKMRSDKGFDSIDCYTDLFKLSLDKKYSVILLECMSNLLANEIYRENSDMSTVVKRITDGIITLQSKCQNLIIVSNDISHDINGYTKETADYINILEEINAKIALLSDVVVEVVCSIPIYHKGKKLER